MPTPVRQTCATRRPLMAWAHTFVATLLTFDAKPWEAQHGPAPASAGSWHNGGGLACARIRHLGRKSANEELLLVRSEKGSPCWMVIEKTLQRRELFEAGIQNHLAKLLSESYR